MRASSRASTSCRCRLGDQVRIRIANLTMTNHPIHLHGHHFAVSLTDGGWVPESAQWPEMTIDVPVGAIRAIEFVADAPGDWAFHCHKSHHTMNAMGHQVKNFIGVRQRDLSRAMRRAAPSAMAMGTDGMADMAEMSMPLPRQHAAHDDGYRTVRADRDGRHVHGDEGARGSRARRLSRSRLV